MSIDEYAALVIEAATTWRSAQTSSVVAPPAERALLTAVDLYEAALEVHSAATLRSLSLEGDLG